PERDHLAFEVWRPGIAQALARLPEPPPANLRFVEADAAQALGHLLGPGSVTELWTYFPDPWPKTRHHKRRLVTPAFADTVARVGGGGWRRTGPTTPSTSARSSVPTTGSCWCPPSGPRSARWPGSSARGSWPDGRSSTWPTSGVPTPSEVVPQS